MCLYSARNSLITVYPISWSEDPEQRISSGQSNPFGLEISDDQACTRAMPLRGLVLFQHPAQTGVSFDVFQLTSGCAVIRTRICVTAQEEDFRVEDTVAWSEEVEQLARRTKQDLGPHAARESYSYDFRQLYESELRHCAFHACSKR